MANLSTARRLWLNGKEIKVLSVNGNKCFERSPYQCEVEYLQSTGTQYIDTQIPSATPTTDSVQVVVRFRLDSGRYFGSYNEIGIFGRKKLYGTTDNSAPSLFLNKNLVVHMSCDFVSGQTYVVGAVCVVGNTYDISATFNYPSGRYIVVNGINYGNSEKLNKSLRKTSDIANFLVFADGPIDRGSDISIYSCSLLVNGVLVRDFIPVLDWNDTPCLYDKVSGQLFYNAGTGEFLYGEKVVSE